MATKAEEVCRELCHAAFVTENSFICPKAFEKAVRMARKVIAELNKKEEPWNK